MNIILFEDHHHASLRPLSWLRPAFELRCGRDRLIEKIRVHFGPDIVRVLVREELREVVEERTELAAPAADAHWCLINARTLVTGNVMFPSLGTAWMDQDTLLAATVAAEAAEALTPDVFLDAHRLRDWVEPLRHERAPEVLRLIEYPWDLVAANEKELERQCRQGSVCEGRVYDGAHLLNAGQIHIAPGAKIKPGVVLDAEDGPIHIDRDVLIQANAVITGPACIGRGSIVRSGASIRGGTTIGPVCKVGGEIEASVFQGYANKQHDGFLGHSFVCPWVNLGADTVTSDLKNTYGSIRVNLNGVGVETGRHFVGSFIGDHSKTGIGTILPTGCVIGVAANVFVQSRIPKFVPSFAWLTDEGLTNYRLDKALRIARIVMTRRDQHLSDAEAALIERTADLAREAEADGWQSAAKVV